MEFKDPWVLLFVPILCALLWIVNRRQKKEVLHFSSVNIFDGLKQGWKIRFAWLPRFAQACALISLLIALAGPQYLLKETIISGQGIDIVLALDTSGSMAAEDFTINGQRLNRLEVIKNVVKDFIKNRKYDQIGLIAFAARAYTVCPLTLDHDWLLTNLGRIKLGIIEDGTAIGSGLSSALIRLKKSTAKSKIIVLLTDGMNNAGNTNPLDAAQIAKSMGVKIYTIGAGTKEMAPFPIGQMNGRVVYQQVRIDIDEQTLKSVAIETGGKYFRATDTESLKDIYKQIDILEKSKIEQRGFKHYQPLFEFFVWATFIFIFIEIVLLNSIFLKVP